jgi:hypothetical protein
MNGKPFKNCPDPERLMEVIVDRRGTPDEQHTLRRHIEVCSQCASLVSDMKTTRKLVSTHKPARMYLSPDFATTVVGAIKGEGISGLLEDILGLSRKVVTTGAFLVIILLGIMLFPEDSSVDIPVFDELVIVNGIESEFLVKDELTGDDIVMMTFSNR